MAERPLTVELEEEADGRWIAEIVGLPGVMAYGATRAEAVAKAEDIALRVQVDNQPTQVDNLSRSD